MLTLKNDKCYIEFDENKEIFGRDLTDHYNDPAFYNKSIRGIKKAWEALTVAWNDNMRMYDAMGILRQNNIKTHSYCMMD
jgi:hypothetical protein